MEKGVDTQIITNVRRNNKHPDVLIYDKGKRKIALIEVGIT